MCVIIVKPQGIPFPSMETQELAFKKNKDGAGFMYARNGKVQIRKGFMTFEKYRKALNNEHLTEADTVVMHFRIGTTGSTSPKNCHPFPITSVVKDLRKLYISTDLAVAHNGIISYESNDKLDFSDTMSFIYDILSDDAIKPILFNTSMLSLLEMAIGASKLAFLNPEGECMMVGQWVEHDTEKDGCMYSNTHFLPYIPKYNYQTNVHYIHGNTTGYKYEVPIEDRWEGMTYDRKTGEWLHDPDKESSWENPIYDHLSCKWRNMTVDELVLCGNRNPKEFNAQQLQEITNNAKTVKEREAKEQELKEAELWDKFVLITPETTNCPECKYPISNEMTIYCTKCGIMLYRDVDTTTFDERNPIYWGY